MGIYNTVNAIKNIAMKLTNCSMASFGDINLYDNKKTILYPYINIDIIQNQVMHNAIDNFSLRIYVMDRNEPYVAYNKCELILDNLMLKLNINNYTTNYITLDYQDVINGVYTDIIYNNSGTLDCSIYIDDFLIDEENQEVYILTEEEGKIEINI